MSGMFTKNNMCSIIGCVVCGAKMDITGRPSKNADKIVELLVGWTMVSRRERSSKPCTNLDLKARLQTITLNPLSSSMESGPEVDECALRGKSPDPNEKSTTTDNKLKGAHRDNEFGGESTRDSGMVLFGK
jgi:hypothetical protein